MPGPTAAQTTSQRPGPMTSRSLKARSGPTSDAGVSHTEGSQINNRWIASDPRLSGLETATANWHRCLSPDISVREVGVGAMTRVLENDDGRWVGPKGFAIDTGIDPGRSDIVVMRGEGAYEGLTAVIVMEQEGIGYAPFVGAIFPGEIPPAPELPAE